MIKSNISSNNRYSSIPVDTTEVFSQADKYIPDDNTDTEMADSISNVNIKDEEVKLSVRDYVSDKQDVTNNKFKNKMKKYITGWTNYYITNKDGLYETSKMYWQKVTKYSKRLPNNNLAITISYKRLLDTNSANKLTAFLWLEYTEWVKCSKEEYKLACTKYTIAHDEKQALLTQYFGKQTPDNVKLLARKHEEDLKFIRFLKGLHHRRFNFIQEKYAKIENNPYNYQYIKSIKDKDELIKVVLNTVINNCNKSSNNKKQKHNK